jgi:hypothetical protein
MNGDHHTDMINDQSLKSSTDNEKNIIQQLIKSKEEIITAKEDLISFLKEEISRLRKHSKR